MSGVSDDAAAAAAAAAGTVILGPKHEILGKQGQTSGVWDKDHSCFLIDSCCFVVEIVGRNQYTHGTSRTK